MRQTNNITPYLRWVQVVVGVVGLTSELEDAPEQPADRDGLALYLLVGGSKQQGMNERFDCSFTEGNIYRIHAPGTAHCQAFPGPMRRRGPPS